VTLYEADHRLGGHTNTVQIKSLDGKSSIGVDTGFIVCNPVTYPNFLALMDHLSVPLVDSNMSFSMSRNQGEFEWAGKNLDTVFCQRRNLLPDFQTGGMYALIYDLWKFNHQAFELANESDQLLFEGKGRKHPLSEMTIGEFLKENGYSQFFYDNYIIPMTSAIWSSPADVTFRDFPVLTLIKFMRNHCLLQVGGRPVWRTVGGGSKSYIESITKDIQDIRLSTAITKVERRDGKVTLYDSKGGIEVYNHVIFATHSDQALKILGESASEKEKSILGAIKYSGNRAILHRDAAQMPVRRSAWSSWNYMTNSKNETESTKVSLTYYMNKLQPFVDTQKYGEVFVTLNPIWEPRKETIIEEIYYEHPVYDLNVIDD
jgi:predicted NAD/FAD-binding protein